MLLKNYLKKKIKKIDTGIIELIFNEKNINEFFYILTHILNTVDATANFFNFMYIKKYSADNLSVITFIMSISK